jgi:hypothetical protein
MNELKILNRINLLQARKADNSNIIRKLQRQLRNLKEGG